MSKRNRREHGRILSVETMRRGDALAADVASGATSITVNDSGDFDEDGGWLYIGGQTVEYTACDDDTGVITLATALTAAGEEGDPVHVWSDLYGEVVDYQQALVELDGEYDNPDPVVAEVAEGVEDLPEGDRGKAGESCTLKRVADDEWEIVEVGGRPRKSKGIKFEADDIYILSASDVTAGTVTFDLSHRPIRESLVGFWGGVPQEPTEYSIDYDAQTVTWPLEGFEKAGDRLWVHYAYRKGLGGGSQVLVNWEATGWKHLQVTLADTTDRSAPGFDDSSWATDAAAFGNMAGHPQGWPDKTTGFASETGLWVRRAITIPVGMHSIDVEARIDNYLDVYVDGVLIGSHTGFVGAVGPFSVAVSPGSTITLACLAKDDAAISVGDYTYFDAKVTARG